MHILNLRNEGETGNEVMIEHREVGNTYCNMTIVITMGGHYLYK